MAESVPARSPNGRFLELARRMVALVLLIIGGTAIVFQPEDLFVVEALDWSADYAAEDNTKEPITQYIDRKLHGQYRMVTDPTWKAVHEDVTKESTSPGKPALKIFAHNHPLFPKHEGIVLVQQGPERRYLRIKSQSLRYPPSGFAPSFLLVHPYLPYGIPFVLLSIVAYALLRWKRTATPIHYKPWIPAIMDATALLFVGPGVFIVARGIQMSWGDAIMAAVILALVGLAVLLPAAYFASKRAVLLQDRVRVLTLFGQTDFPFARTPSSYVMREAQAPILGIILIVLAITNLVSAILGIVLLVRKDERFTLKRDDGKAFKMWVKSANGLPQLQQALAANGVANESIG